MKGREKRSGDRLSVSKMSRKRLAIVVAGTVPVAIPFLELHRDHQPPVSCSWAQL